MKQAKVSEKVSKGQCCYHIFGQSIFSEKRAIFNQCYDNIFYEINCYNWYYYILNLQQLMYFRQSCQQRTIFRIIFLQINNIDPSMSSSLPSYDWFPLIVAIWPSLVAAHTSLIISLVAVHKNFIYSTKTCC
jgi:hypothetical protein